MRINLKKNLFAEKFYPYLFDYSHRFECFMGSAGSGKSYFITQKIILRAMNEQIRVLVCRRYRVTLRQTCFSLFIDILKKWRLLEYCKVNKSDLSILLPNGSEILFTGLDEETKLLSLNNISCIWVEEAYEVPQNMVEQLNLRMRGDSTSQQIIMSWNPINRNHWLYEFCEVSPPDSFIYHHSTFRDNPFLNKEYINSLEELYIRNPQRARIFCDGEWGIDTDGLVFTDWEIRDFEIDDKWEHRNGMDFGFKDPSAIIESFYDRENKTIYINQEFYKTNQTLDQLLQGIYDLELRKCKIVCDSAEPRSIDFFRRNNINAYPCVKGPNSVEARIRFLQNHHIVVRPSCKNMIMELENFSFIPDKQTGKFSDKMTHEYSHAVDALGYGYSDLYTKSKLQTLDRKILGI